MSSRETGIAGLFSKRKRNTSRKREKQTLDSLKESLFAKICAPGPNSEFITKLRIMNNAYIEEISGELEEYIDRLVTSVGIDNLLGKDLKGNMGDNTSIVNDLREHCHKDIQCVVLPGTAYFDQSLTFIPQIYHVLADYGFFYRYLEFPELVNSSNHFDKNGVKIPRYTYLSSRWSFRLANIMEAYSIQEKIEFLEKISFRIRRVQFMRSFELNICREGKEYPEGSRKRISYDGFNEFLSDVFDSLQEEIRLKRLRQTSESK